MRKANAAYVRKDPNKWNNAGWTPQPNFIIRHPEIPPDECWAWSWLASHNEDFEVSGRKLYEAKDCLGRNRAYELLSALERRGLLLRHHVYDDATGVPYVQYDLQPAPVPEDQRTWEPPRAAPRPRGPHPGSKAAQAAPPDKPVDNSVSAGQDGFPTGREHAGQGRIPDRAGIRTDQDVPALSGTTPPLPDRAGRGVPDRAGIRTSIQKNTLEEQKDTGGQLPLLGGGSPPPTPDASPTGSVPPHADLEADFEEFYKSYPRRTGRQEARRKFGTAVKKHGVTGRELVDGARRYAEAMVGTPNQYVKHPATWLHQGCWADEHPAPETQPVRDTEYRGSSGYQPYQSPDPSEYHKEW
jgi:hypothetical protein